MALLSYSKKTILFFQKMLFLYLLEVYNFAYVTTCKGFSTYIKYFFPFLGQLVKY